MDTQINDTDVIATSKIFQRGKTVIPSEVRALISVSDGDNIVWRYDKMRGIIYIGIAGGKPVRYTLSREKSST